VKYNVLAPSFKRYIVIFSIVLWHILFRNRQFLQGQLYMYVF